MNEEFRNENGFGEAPEAEENQGAQPFVPEIKKEPEAPQEAAETAPEAPAEEETVSAEAVPEAQPYIQPPAPEQPAYQQYAPNAQYNQQGCGYYQQYPQYQQYQPVQTPPQKPEKSGKGLKIFVIVICALLAVAIGICAYIIKNFTYDPSSGNTQVTEEHQIVDGNAPDFEAGETPDSSLEIPESGPLTAAQAYAKASPANVGIVVYSRNSSTNAAGEGTGIIMGEDKSGEYTYIVTCAHVISDSGINVRVQTHDGTAYDAQIVGFDTRTDIGVVKIKANGLPKADFGDSGKLHVGDTVYAIGNPGGVEFFGSFTSGSVSAIDRPVSSEIGYTMTCIQHDAAINPGNSGGMLINEYGQVIGINSQKIAATNYEGMGFAIPISDAMEIINSLIDFGYVPNRPKLGINYYSLSASSQYSMIAQINGLPAGTLIIGSIDAESSLNGTDIQKYDMIIAVNGKKLTSPDVLLELIDNGKVGDKLNLTIARINNDYSVSTFDVEATLVEDKSTAEATTENYYVDPFSNGSGGFYFGF